jgi:KaiC/GvpD/RAD55 family RecA-like ATPase
MKDTAKKYRDRFGWAVIPIKPKGKKPAIASWREFQSRKMTDEEIEKNFTNGCNIALLTGEISAVDVIDIDSYKESYKDINLESQVKVSTPRGGTHLYFKHTEGLRPSVNEKLAVDVRGNGSYVLIPPSIGPNEKPYKWVGGVSKKSLLSLKTLPSGLIKKVQKFSTERFNVEEAFNIPEGARDDTLHRAAVSLLSKHPEDIAWKLLLALNRSYKPPLSERTVEEKFKSARRFVSQNPPQGQNALPSSVEVSPDWKTTTPEEDIDNVKKQLLEGRTLGIPSGFPSLDKITGGLIPSQSYLIFADTSVGKSVFILNILIFLAKNGVKTMYFDLENDFTESIQRQVLINEGSLTRDIWQQMIRAKQIDEPLESLKKLTLTTWDLTKLSNRFGFINFESIESCIKEGISEGYQIFAIDHLHYFEESLTDFAKLADISKRINDLVAKNKVVVLVAAHTSKRGSPYEKDGNVKIRRPLLEYISGSALITKHTKNAIGLMRNSRASDEVTRKQTTIFVDKTKVAPTGWFSLTFNEGNLRFIDSLEYEIDPWQYLEGEYPGNSKTRNLKPKKKMGDLHKKKAQLEFKLKHLKGTPIYNKRFKENEDVVAQLESVK